MRWQRVAAFALVLAACVTVIPDIPAPVSFAVFGVVFVAVGALGILDERSLLTVTARPSVLVGALMVWLALCIGLVKSPTFSGVLRVGAFVVFTGAAFFVLPSLIPHRDIYRATTVIAATFSVFGIITAATGAVGTLGIYRWTSLSGVAYAIPLSLFGNPNTLASVALLGALAASGIALLHRPNETPTSRGGAAILAAICALVVVLSGSRAALLALIAGGGVLVVARTGNPQMTTFVTVGGLTVLVGILAGAAIVGVNFSGRLELWNAAIHGVAARPLFGWGPGADAATLAQFLPPDSRFAGRFGTHSSYFRLFFIGGIVGGIGYLLLCLSSLRGALAAANRDATTLALVVGVFVFFIFENGTLFGLSPISFVGALAVGYAQHHDAVSEASLFTSRATTVWRVNIDHMFAIVRDQ